MAALRCNAAARSGFLLAALHSVAERVNPRKARPPAPHGPRVLATRRRPHLPLLGEECTTPGLSKNQNTESYDLFHPRGHSAMARQMGTELRIVAAEACGAVFRANGDKPRRVVRLPMADSLCDRMERGEEEAPDRRRGASPSTNSADVKAVRFRRAAAENFRPEIFEARATLREQRESAVGRRLADPQPSPFARKTARHASATATPQVCPRLPGIEECPHFLHADCGRACHQAELACKLPPHQRVRNRRLHEHARQRHVPDIDQLEPRPGR